MTIEVPDYGGVVMRRGQWLMILLFWVYLFLFAFSIIPMTAGTVALLAFLAGNTGALCARYAN